MFIFNLTIRTQNNNNEKSSMIFLYLTSENIKNRFSDKGLGSNFILIV